MGQQNNKSDDDGISKPLDKKRSRTLVVTVITGIAIVLFCVFTYARTRFETYPTSPNLATVASPPKGFSEQLDQPYDLGELDIVDEDEGMDEPEERGSVSLSVIFLEEDHSHNPASSSVAAGSHPTQMAVHHTAPAPQDTFVQRIQAQQQELDSAQQQLRRLQIALEDKEQENQQLRQQQQQPAADAPEAPSVSVQEVIQQNLKLERELADVQLRLNQVQRYLNESEQSQRDLRFHSKELEKNNQTLLQEKQELEKRQQQIQTQAEESEQRFRTLNATLRSQKIALQKMDHTRVQLSQELSATKQQYAELLRAVASKGSVANASEIAFQQPTESKTQVTHTVQRGDTLSEISRQQYGTPIRWQEIYEANKDRIPDIKTLKVGTVLIIPGG